jgi:hypothetical protein
LALACFTLINITQSGQQAKSSGSLPYIIISWDPEKKLE